MDSSQSTLSESVASTDLDSLWKKRTVEKRLSDYHREKSDDDTSDFLRTVFGHLPSAGKTNLASDIAGCEDDEMLRKLAMSIDTGLLRPVQALGGTPAPLVLSPRLGLDDSIENLASEDTPSASRSEQSRLRKACLERDNHRCVVSGFWDPQHPDLPDGATECDLEGAHILPYSIGEYDERSEDSRYRHCAIWVNIHRYFPDLRARMNFTSEQINDVTNVITLCEGLHKQFGLFHFVFEPTDTINKYKVKTFKSFRNVYSSWLPVDRLVRFTAHNVNIALPNPVLLEFHAAIGNILNLTARGETIEKLRHDFGEMGGSVLAQDGSTNVGDLLSISKLSLLAPPTRYQEEETPKPASRHLRTELPGAENKAP
ncbi:hypothetical protein BJY04DRAFT_183490 [Aspergillus karnatakaensis]|uniref:HNH endonuclease signature motif containing protein n=1 Tax=Aspergillus karnatakaensis TaxID=1810916 RepID=UPI003CCE1553